jgi:hypothetical protein
MGEHRPHLDHARAPVVRPLDQFEDVARHVDFSFELIELDEAPGEKRVVGVEQFDQAAVPAQDVIEQQDRLGPQVRRNLGRIVRLQFGQ